MNPRHLLLFGQAENGAAAAALENGGAGGAGAHAEGMPLSGAAGGRGGSPGGPDAGAQPPDGAKGGPRGGADASLARTRGSGRNFLPSQARASQGLLIAHWAHFFYGTGHSHRLGSAPRLS